MKYKITLLIAFALMSSIYCQEIKSKDYSVNVAISDNENHPVCEAKVTGSNEKIISLEPVPRRELIPVSIYSDVNGFAFLKLSRLTQVPSGYLVEKEGYYKTLISLDWSGSSAQNHHREIQSNAIIKKMRNPIAMNVANFISKDICIPKCEVEYLYDLELNEFLPPLGAGVTADIVMTIKDCSNKDDVVMVASIKAKEPGCGFFHFGVDSRESGSIFWSDYEAPPVGYFPEFTLRFDSKHPEKNMNQDQNNNFYFRVRPKINPITRETTWHYGKIYGPISFWAMKQDWSSDAAIIKLDSVYFNPSAGDRNVEFDPGKNLLKNMGLCRP